MTIDVKGHPASKGLSRIGAYFIDALTGKNDDMGRPCPDVPRLHWIIAGGESGPRARPSNPEWFRSLRNQCAAAGIPFFFKQWGEHDHYGRRVGKKRAGRTLDGALHDGFPRPK